MSATTPHPADSRSRDAGIDDFLAWLPADPVIRVAIQFRHGQWYALAPDFNIAGAGATHLAAYRNLGRLMGAYLMSHYRDGNRFEDALKPVRWQTRLGILVGTTLWRLIGKLPQLVPREARFVLPEAFFSERTA